MIAIALVALLGAVQQPQVYSADLSKCLVEKTTEADRVQLIKWLFASVSASPQVADMTRITDAERTAYQRRAGELFNRLMTVDCRKETVAALRYEGIRTIESGFSVLGGVAMRGLMSDPAVTASMGEMATSTTTPALKAVLREAGITGPEKPAAK